MKVTRAVALLLVAGAALVAATPANALLSAGASANCGYTVGGASQTCSGTAQDVPTIGSGSDVQATCATTTPFAVQATIVKCYILGNLGDTHYTDEVLTQGRASTLTWNFPSWSLTSRSYRVCVGGGYFNNGYFKPINFRCNPGV